ncbi:MAG: DUF465 domain-containing protein [Alphaproteobacteria bacterium]
MKIESHIAELEEKHHRLEAEIQEELQHPGADGLHLSELKREKLRIKDRLERLRVGSTSH